ncbi:hypothetical protein [Kineosporia sp. A_224]|uniref:hypothetical protein n=1 Tax=Kineosporia sp. A_224 TaxID=1962180 RepID=UPI000B4AE508|nr:hypothetical protein [Kineosporia sp. A_224]
MATALPLPHHRHAAARTQRSTGAVTTTARLVARLLARGTLVLAVSLAAYVLLEVLSFRAAYSGGTSTAQLALFDTPAIRMLQGPPHGIGTAGGFTAWDGGWFMAATVAVWALLVSTRLLRGEEDVDRVAALLAGPLPARTLATVQLAVLAAGGAVVAAAVTATLGGLGEGWTGGALFGLTIGGFAVLWAGVGAVCAQAFDNRRRALSAAVGVFGAAYLLRLVANSSTDREGLRVLTPWGWLDAVEPYAAQRLAPVLGLWAAGAVLGAVAVALRGRRDTGGAFLTRPDRRPARLRGLGSPAAFAWREGRGVLVAWALGLAVWTTFLGGMLGTMLDFFTADDAYRGAVEAMGLGAMLTADGFVAVMSVILGLALALFAAWRVGAARAEEADGRLESLLVRGVTRRRWLGGQLLVVLAGTVGLAALAGVATWFGARLSGADLALDASLGSALNQLPVAVLFVGLATLCLGGVPRLTLTLPASLAAAGYVVELVGPALDWPGWVLDLSPFHHLALVPLEAFAAAPALWLVGLGLLATLAGVLLLERRDVTSA